MMGQTFFLPSKLGKGVHEPELDASVQYKMKRYGCPGEKFIVISFLNREMYKPANKKKNLRDDLQCCLLLLNA